MSRNFEPAFVGHPGVDPLAQARRRVIPAHATVAVPPGMEYRITFKDGKKSDWMLVCRGAMSMPPAADLIEMRRKA